jgi:hypothetical protein
LISGLKLTQIYQCRASFKAAFAYTGGRHESFVPAEMKHLKTSKIELVLLLSLLYAPQCRAVSAH